MKAVVSGEKFISPIVKVLLLLRRQRVAGQGGNRESSPEPMSPCNGGDRGMAMDMVAPWMFFES